MLFFIKLLHLFLPWQEQVQKLYGFFPALETTEKRLRKFERTKRQLMH